MCPFQHDQQDIIESEVETNKSDNQEKTNADINTNIQVQVNKLTMLIKLMKKKMLTQNQKEMNLNVICVGKYLWMKMT